MRRALFVQSSKVVMLCLMLIGLSGSHGSCVFEPELHVIRAGPYVEGSTPFEYQQVYFTVTYGQHVSVENRQGVDVYVRFALSQGHEWLVKVKKSRVDAQTDRERNIRTYDADFYAGDTMRVTVWYRADRNGDGQFEQIVHDFKVHLPYPPVASGAPVDQ